MVSLTNQAKMAGGVEPEGPKSSRPPVRGTLESTVISTRVPLDTSDTVSLIVALLMRYPELASVRSHPTDGTLRVSFVVNSSLEKKTVRQMRASIIEHIETFLGLDDVSAATLDVECEVDEAMTFIHIDRDYASFSKEELMLAIDLLSERFGEKLVKNPTADETLDDEEFVREELVDYAIDTMKDADRQKSLVGIREEKRVLIYFLKSKKKVKARARR